MQKLHWNLPKCILLILREAYIAGEEDCAHLRDPEFGVLIDSLIGLSNASHFFQNIFWKRYS